MTGPVFVKEVRNHPFPYETYVNLETVEKIRLFEGGYDNPEVTTITGKKSKVDFSDLITPAGVNDE